MVKANVVPFRVARLQPNPVGRLEWLGVLEKFPGGLPVPET